MPDVKLLIFHDDGEVEWRNHIEAVVCADPNEVHLDDSGGLEGISVMLRIRRVEGEDGKVMLIQGPDLTNDARPGLAYQLDLTRLRAVPDPG